MMPRRTRLRTEKRLTELEGMVPSGRGPREYGMGSAAALRRCWRR
jgi:hypothetical protein